MDRRKFVTGALAAPLVGALGTPARAQAQAWPTRNLTMVVAFPPGGQADLAARPIALSLERSLGKSVIVDNRAGAGGLVGNAFVARSDPDGYTLLMALSSMTFLPDAERLYDRKPSYELDSFIPIARALADRRAARAVADLEPAVRDAEIIATATMATSPVLHGEWISPGTHVDLIGAYRPDMREVDDETLRRARLFVDSRATTLGHIGEVQIPIDSGVISETDILGDFYDLPAGAYCRRSDDEITVAKNGGGAHLDLMTASYILSVAESGAA